jgi:hypothetical protein
MIAMDYELHWIGGTWLNQPMVRRSLFISMSVLLLVSGCRNHDDQIQTYRISKDNSPSMPMASAPMMGGNAGAPSGAPMMGGSTDAPPGAPMMGGNSGAPMMGGGGMGSSGGDMQSMGAGMSPAGSAKEIDWKAPNGWQEQPPSSMRIGSWHAKGSNGQVVDISIVPLSGEAGGDLANVNRWRGQINLEPVTDADLPKMSESISPGGHTMLLLDIVSREPLVDSKYPKRLIAAAYKQGGRTWFFKMTGEDAAVTETKPAFLRFLKSLKFHGTDQ